MEDWNSANTVLHYGKDRALTGPDKEHTEISMLALHLLQSALVHVNTLRLRQVARVGGASLRSRSASMDDAEFDKVTDDLPQFLDHICRCVVSFMEAGAIGDL